MSANESLAEWPLIPANAFLYFPQGTCLCDKGK
jgi:hypothetical protein